MNTEQETINSKWNGKIRNIHIKREGKEEIVITNRDERDDVLKQDYKELNSEGKYKTSYILSTLSRRYNLKPETIYKIVNNRDSYGR